MIPGDLQDGNDNLHPIKMLQVLQDHCGHAGILLVFPSVSFSLRFPVAVTSHTEPLMSPNQYPSVKWNRRLNAHYMNYFTRLFKLNSNG